MREQSRLLNFLSGILSKNQSTKYVVIKIMNRHRVELYSRISELELRSR